jgi:hypothetical protein
MLMAFAIPRNTATAVERRIPFVLVDATDLTTPEDITVTGVKVALSFGGAADANSTNDIVKVDGALGMYYIELTQTEANNAPGPVHGHLQPSGCARTYVEAQIGASDLLTNAPTATDIANAAVEAEWTALKSLARTGTNGNGGLSITMPTTGAQTSTITVNTNASPIVDFG